MTPFENIGRDLGFALRTLRREPTFVAGVIATFALAIGANAAMFGLVTRLMLAPPPGIQGAALVSQVRLRQSDDEGKSFVVSTTSYPMFRSLRGATGAFSAVGASRSDTMLVGRSPNVSEIGVLGASVDYFTALGATPALGRFFGSSDDEPPSGTSVIVLGYAFWQRMFGGDRAVLGKELVVDDQPFTIIGVASRGFNGEGLSSVDAFIPLSASMRKQGGDWMSNRGMNIVSIVARLRADVRPDVARQIASAAIREESSARGSARTPAVELESIVPGFSSRQSPQAKIALWLAAVSLIVLLIATANVGTLLSLRSARRRREIAVRIALGASRGALARQLVAESLLLTAIGAAIGLLLSHWFAAAMRVALLPQLAPDESFVDRRVLAASLVAACAAGIIAGIIPLSQTGRSNLSAQLRSGGHGASTRLTFQNTLVTIQVSLCTLLLVGAALFVRSLQRVQSQDLGFSTQQLLYVTLDFRGYLAGIDRDRVYREAEAHVRALRAVNTTSVAAGIPFGPHNIPPVFVPGMPWPPTSFQLPIMYGATPEYLDMMGATLRGGRLVTDGDRHGAPLVVLVNETMARTLWPGQSALGKCVRMGFGAGGPPPSFDTNPAESAPCREVVGIVRDSRARSLRPEGNEDRIMQYYVPFGQLPDAPIPDQPQVMGMIVRVRAGYDAAGIASLVQQTIQSTSTARVFARVRLYQDLIDPQLRSWRLGATLFSAFSILALSIGAVGMFGVISYLVTQRTQEIGVRRALGGTARGVASLVVIDALRMAGTGVAVGMLGALAAGPLVASMLFQTSPREPASIATAALVLLSVTVLAAAGPAWRAGRVDPVVALRAE